jgi:Spy/CpxP family protein refolding chaperone
MTTSHRLRPSTSALSLLRRARGLLAAGVLAGVAASSVACSAAPPASPPPSAAEQRGPAGVLRLAIDEVDIDADQRADALAIVDDFRAASEPARAERRRVIAALADRIAAGSLTPADAEAALAGFDNAGKLAAPALQDTANRLHALLDEGQREELLSALRDTFRERFRGEGGPRERLRKIAEELQLSEAQRDSIRAKVRAEMERARPAARERMQRAHERMEELADAFVSDSFDAKALGLGQEGATLRRAFAESLLRVTAAVLPELSPAQRQALAEIVRARGEAMGGID